MPAGKIVRPRKWSKVIDLYDDGEYSFIWGVYEKHEDDLCLGARWNETGITKRGFPNHGGHPIWHVEPKIVSTEIIKKLYNLVENNPSLGNLENIEKVLNSL